MRLSTIKLAGFKSFADPVAFQLPGRRIGVVGPNGCGKSNIIDAVRWVLGESRAAELRGDSMLDVIFNGSGSRKPAGRCSVELVFDNSAQRIGGSFGQYAEISVKRVLTRDGGSSYLINNQLVRRRDVQDIFLGTGLGSRSYAIIGQGTISRIIESRPEELRVMLEEAAGVSKYKERRRETENRLHATRENLQRVDDILRELGSQLDKLEQQAAVAQRYRALQEQAQFAQHALWLLRLHEAGQRQQRQHAQTAAAQLELERQTAQLRATEAALEELRQQQQAAADALNAAQGALYAAQAEVSHLEAQIRFVVEARERAQRGHDELQAQRAQWQQRLQAAQQDADAATQEIAGAEQARGQAAAEAQQQGERIPALEAVLADAQMRATDCRAQVAAAQQRLQAQAQAQRSLAQQRQALEQRLQRLQGERRQLQRPDGQRLDELRRQHAALQAAAQRAQAALDALREELPRLQQQAEQGQQQAQRQAADWTATSARLQALRALQQKVMTEGRLQPWLQRHGLQDLARLWSRIQVEPGWETALEAALRERLGALEVRDLAAMAGFADDPPPAKLSFYSAAAAAAPPQDGRLPAVPLARQLRVQDASLRAMLEDWLAPVHAVDSLAQALALRAELPAGMQLVTPQGHLVSRHGVSLYAADSEQAGVLARAQEIDNLERQQRAQRLLSEQAQDAAAQAQAALAQARQQADQAQRELQSLTAQSHALQVDVLRLEQQLEEAGARAQRLDEDIEEAAAQAEELQAQAAEGEAGFEQTDLELGALQQGQADADDQVLAAQEDLAQARARLRALEQRDAEAGYAVRSLRQRADDALRMADTARQQIDDCGARLQTAQQELEGLHDHAARAGLQQALHQREGAEGALQQRRGAHDALNEQLREAERQRLLLERALDPLRESIGACQLQEQEARLQAQQFEDLLQEAQVDREALLQQLRQRAQEQAAPEQLARELQRLQREVEALGAVNLAALEELQQSRERSSFLHAQHADLEQAATTLEDAIRHIDAETRTQLRQTFDEVNGHFGRLFPELFGGGSARLVMTGDEILDAGVQVMAQPPGKRNSTIHLLSGGEKALVAIALVFGIFHLNPAPFCILDEVDAPLDDANTERFARLVEAMSEATQFLFISHNKIAMAMAEQLVGVTMQEQGVSRLVAVELEAAARMAAA